ncbi:MAG TPA: succinate dehydrogenase iron-sulfur subunit [Phycisphaerae bacterium]|nr:succinate dehydrogenase iron-sulfur subunit [Phycisphaerae bacterium]HRY70983.1 succinate dehydrogenase iron-sulfur subunit [Phycisphaerae bacterium]HSA29271.1 succinate dehydrogenase iron-sulfur subunit [Phycisphaerae bacterium]
MAERRVKLKIRRQNGPGQASYWQDFDIPYEAQMNVISCLQRIAEIGRTARGEKVAPVAWECSCLEEVCGACTMIINGRVRQSCTALVDRLTKEEGEVIRLEPMTKFPVVRDLIVDRSRMFADLTKVKAWNPVDGYYDLGHPAPVSPEEQEIGYPLSRCMTCGCCLEACPQVSEPSGFIGPAAINQVALHNTHPTSKAIASQRLEVLMGPGGLSSCGNAQNCVKVCPKEIPLTESIARTGRAITTYACRKFFDR